MKFQNFQWNSPNNYSKDLNCNGKLEILYEKKANRLTIKTKYDWYGQEGKITKVFL